MQVSVRLSGELARLGGMSRVAIELADGATVAHARAALTARIPDLGDALNAALPVIRGNHVAADHPLAGGDELALLLPAAGG